MKSSAMFVSLLVTGESLTCTVRDDPSTSVTMCYSGFDLGETVDVKMDTITSETETFDVTGSGLESIPCLGKSLTKSGQDLMVDRSTVRTKTRSTPTVIKSFIRVDVQFSSSP